MIVPGSASQALGAALAAETGHSLAAVDYERFPDGELMASVTMDDTDRAIVVAATTTDAAHVELLQLQDAVREAGADEVVTVLPYMGYGRQERAFEAGQPVSARAMARAISTGTDRVILVNPHEASVTDFFTVPCTVVDAAAQLADPLPPELIDPLFLSPDAGAIALAESARDAYGRGDVDYFEKVRHSGTEVEITPSDAAVADRDVVVVDDIVATGSTMSESIGVLNDRGAASVIVTCIHPLFARNARTKLERAGVSAIYATDTVERDVTATSVAPVVADVL
ncbi:ribose-phosphate diphosphokinase [Haloplanus aerogenes]|uniref:Ribose-phosphate pyrophosphokinase n=1 Tax=Haloplanus aerogenes TaxID=660522 RepID=A0A3G8QQA0_9EURY|nr:ribose-phosphate diphosphokinase [Haloplanus aerogenes]AZH23881.1 ribose-phosphate diphosphokinase [Haloplanus aerogenes]RMB13360.1 ribose-phosphate pyrophosphokinase [Haloplanus aerogenes]